jgi:choline dehydrogenase-like flavoprotein
MARCGWRHPNRDVAPLIDLALLSDERDVAGMTCAMSLARAVGEAKALKPWCGSEVIPGQHISSEEQVWAHLRSTSALLARRGTCRMGQGEGPSPALICVHGIDGLRVIDASVMPSLPSANTNATVLAIADAVPNFVLTDSCRSQLATVGAVRALSGNHGMAPSDRPPCSPSPCARIVQAHSDRH